MWASNAYLDGMLYVCEHARERWVERAGEMDLGRTLREAMPFGVQKGGDSVLLAANEMVFVVERRGSRRTVVTCMTKEQALVNMQNIGVRVKIPLRPGEAQPLHPEIVQARQSAQATADRMMEQTGSLSAKTDEELAAFEATTLRIRDEIGNAKISRRLNLFLQNVQRELGARRTVAKYKRHASLMDANRQALRKAIHEIVPHQQQAIFARASAILEIMGDDIGLTGWHEMLAERERGLTTSPASAQ